jgi:hypothetical protein
VMASKKTDRGEGKIPIVGSRARGSRFSFLRFAGKIAEDELVPSSMSAPSAEEIDGRVG